MSREVTEGNKERVLRRSRRHRTAVVSESNSSTDSIGSEAETVVGWNTEDVVVTDREESESVEGREYSFGEFSNTAYHDLKFGKKSEEFDKEGRMSKEASKDSGRGVTPDAGLGDFMRLYLDEQRRIDNRREQERREEIARREEERREEIARREEERRETREREERERAEARDREERMWQAMNRVAATPDPEPRAKSMISLPFMKEGEEITEFLPQFEAALDWGKVPQDQKRELLISHLPISLLMRVKSQVDDDGSYEELVRALNSSSTLTFSAAAEDLCTGERGRIWEMTGSKAIARVKGLVSQVTKDADTKPDMIECITVALVRDKLVPSLKSYIDSARRFGIDDFRSACEEWERAQPNQTSWFKKRTLPGAGSRVQGSNGQFQGKRSVVCYSCGKSGHVSRECRSRPQGEAVTTPAPTAVPAAPSRANAKADVTCFRCRAKGHKSPDCPLKPKSNRRVILPDSDPFVLQHDEEFGSIGDCKLCVTVDSAAQLSLVPKECVRPDQFTGKKQWVMAFNGALEEGDMCRVDITVAGRIFPREAVALPGDTIRWKPCLSVHHGPQDDMLFLVALPRERRLRGQGEVKYQPPKMINGKLQSRYLVSESDVVMQTPNTDVPKIAVVEKIDDSPEECVQGLMNIGIDEDERSSECFGLG